MFQTSLENRIINAMAISRQSGIRRKVFYQHGNQCRACNREHELNEDTWHADHIIPLSKGGNNHISNLQLLCRDPCHNNKTQKQRKGLNDEKYRKHIREYEFNKEWVQHLKLHYT